MPASKAEQVLEALKASLETIPEAVVERNSVLPEKIPDGGRRPRRHVHDDPAAAAQNALQDERVQNIELATAGYARRVGETLAGQLAALKGTDGQAAIAEVAQAIAALESDLGTAKGTLEHMQRDLGGSAPLAGLNLQLSAAEGRLGALDLQLERLKASQHALRTALAAQAQLPSPPKPR
jgi:uncharacterized protein YdbL (DUF1318 family)